MYIRIRLDFSNILLLKVPEDSNYQESTVPLIECAKALDFRSSDQGRVDSSDPKQVKESKFWSPVRGRESKFRSSDRGEEPEFRSNDRGEESKFRSNDQERESERGLR